VGVLESKEFKEQWEQYSKDMLSTGRAGTTEMAICADTCQMRLAIYELQDTQLHDMAQLVLKHVPTGADQAPWAHVLSVKSSIQGFNYMPTDILQTFEPMWPADSGEFLFEAPGFVV
jgi:hypothetical protein